MKRFYHGSSVLFDRFDIAHVLEGDGKVKFGYGVYLTSSFRSAAHYAGANKSASTHFVYTVEIPDVDDDSHIDFKKPVDREIIKRAEARLGGPVPEWVTLEGKDFRKYIAKALGGGTDLQSEKLASEFLVSIGVEQIFWPYNWRNPDLGKNVCVLDDHKIKIVCVHRVELDAKQQLIPKSEKEVTL